MKILMVCLGNICRSPLAQGILEQKIKEHQLEWKVDSAGTGSWHAGEMPDKRSIQVAHENGIDITNQCARQIISNDLDHFDLILAMDVSNYNDILRLCKSEEQSSKVHILLNYLYEGENRSVPDPYFAGGFDKVYTLLDIALEKFVKIKKEELQDAELLTV
jgi:protein-tyrosine phosphatase